MDERARQLLLDQLCVELGFCLPPSDQKRLREEPLEDADTFAEEVFRAEGLDPETAPRRLFRQVRDRIRTAIERAARS